MHTIRKLTGLVAAAALLGGCVEPTNSADPTSVAASSSSVVSASSVAPRPVSCEQLFLRTLSVPEKVAQLLMVGVRNADDARRAVRQYGVGGIFVGSWTDRSIFTGGALKEVSAAGKVPLMVSVDEEGGRVSRVPGANLVSARELAATRTPEQVRAEGRRVGALMASMGITVDFAPDADVSAQPADSVIGDRSYSNDPPTVARYSQAFAAGLRDAGIFPVYKHFPGHGSSSGDSHKGGVSIPPLNALMDKDLVPFRQAAAERAGIMVGHLTVPGLTEPGLPTSLSPATMRLLRDGAGYGAPAFAGPIFTDDLSGMRAITDRFSVPQAVSRALEAGADVALWISTDQLGGAVDEVVTAVKQGRLRHARLDASVLRVARAKGLLSC